MQLFRKALSVFLLLAGSLVCAGAGALFGLCGPFTDTAADAFCPFVLEILTLGITTGTTPTTYSPSDNVTRLQMSAFLSRSVDGVLRRGSRRAIAGQFWTPQNFANLGVTTVGSTNRYVASDGSDLWVTLQNQSAVARVRESDGKVLETWTGAGQAWAVATALGKILVTGDTDPGNLYRIDPAQTAGVVTTVASNLGGFPEWIAYDGGRIWTANDDSSLSIITPGASLPWTVTTVATAFEPSGMLYDGTNIWVTTFDDFSDTLKKLDGAGAVLQSVLVGHDPINPVYDGTNIWVPVKVENSVVVVRASTGAVLATLTGNGLANPQGAAFDGQRFLVTNGGGVLSLWKAADLTPLGSVPTGGIVQGACSDGNNFWIVASGGLLRF